MPRTRLPKKLPTRPDSEDKNLTNKRSANFDDKFHWNQSLSKPGLDADEDEDDGDKTWDHDFIKSRASQEAKLRMKSAGNRVIEKEKEKEKTKGKSKK
jgi:hypothetical protein